MEKNLIRKAGTQEGFSNQEGKNIKSGYNGCEATAGLLKQERRRSIVFLSCFPGFLIRFLGS
jgi:hypothetical protein